MSESQETHFGFKKITNANWQQFDEVTKLWCQITAAAKTTEDWIKFFSYPPLDPKVPEEIAKLLEAARGAMIYGWYFKPLLTLGDDQCWRILETGVRVRCKQASIPINTTFDGNIKALVKNGIISTSDEKRWEAIRNLRNEASHPKQQLGLDPGRAQSDLSSVVNCLNDLFHWLFPSATLPKKSNGHIALPSAQNALAFSFSLYAIAHRLPIPYK
jgi:hypothetical protein